MRIRVTSVTATEVGQKISEQTVRIEDLLLLALASADYGEGIDQLVFMFVSVDDDLVENERYCVANNYKGRYKDMLSGQAVRFLSFAIPIEPRFVRKLSATDLGALLKAALLEELTDPAFAMPKKFNREQAIQDIKHAFKQ